MLLTCLNPHIRIIHVYYCHQYRIKVGNLGSQPNNKKYGKKNEREPYQLNLYPIINHGDCRSQFQIWPLWSPYFYTPFSIVNTNRSINMSPLGWSCEVVWWSSNVFLHNFWNSPRNFVFWLMKTLTRAPNLLSTLSKNAHVPLHCYNMATTPTPTTWRNVQS